MLIKHLYKQHCKDIEYIDLQDTTPDKVKEDHDLATTYYLAVAKDDDPDTILTVHYSMLLVETPIGKCSTWDEVKQSLTNVLVDSYAASVPDFENPQKALISYQLLPSEDFDVAFTSIQSPEERNISRFRWRLTDLVVTKLNEDLSVDFKNCLVTINGLISRPIIYKDELYIKDGTKFMHDTTEDKEPNITLLDFGELGGIDIVPFSKCSYKVKTNKTIPTWDADIEFYLPEDIDLTNATVFPVVLNTLFWPNDTWITSKRTVTISPQKLPLHIAMLKQDFRTNHFVDGTSIIVTDYQLKDYITTTMFEDSHYGAFFLIVKNPNIFIKKVHAQNYTDTLYTTTANVNGLIFDQTTQSFLDSTRVPYTSTTDFYLQPIPSIMRLDDSTAGLYGRQYAIETHRCLHTKNKFVNYNDNDIYVVTMIGG